MPCELDQSSQTPFEAATTPGGLCLAIPAELPTSVGIKGGARFLEFGAALDCSLAGVVPGPEGRSAGRQGGPAGFIEWRYRGVGLAGRCAPRGRSPGPNR